MNRFEAFVYAGTHVLAIEYLKAQDKYKATLVERRTGPLGGIIVFCETLTILPMQMNKERANNGNVADADNSVVLAHIIRRKIHSIMDIAPDIRAAMESTIETPFPWNVEMYKDAIGPIQSASNITGIIRTLAQYTERIWDEARDLGQGTDYVNKHPVIRMFMEQFTWLNVGHSLLELPEDEDGYQRAYELCARRAIPQEGIYTSPSWGGYHILHDVGNAKWTATKALCGHVFTNGSQWAVVLPGKPIKDREKMHGPCLEIHEKGAKTDA